MPVESVVKDASGEVAILCIDGTRWVSRSDAVSHILNRKVAYVVDAPNQSIDVLVSVEEQPNPNMPARLTATVGDANADLLSALPPCNVADSYQYVPWEQR